jgi:FAD/FMN-containing dehydrogenase
MSITKLGTLASFKENFDGRFTGPEDDGYAALLAECVWNGDIDRHPWGIASCTTASDVATAIRFARDAGLEFTVRGGGHNFAGSCVADGALMIDLGPMCEVHVDPAGKRATCGGGTRWLQLDAATQEFGLATPGGFVSHTGVGGLTLGGGLGWLSRKAGLSADNVISVEIVTADGRVLRASEDENPDLYWAVRGGGGNFGIVTEFEFRLHDVGPIVHLGLTFWGLDTGPAAFRAARDLVSSLPDDVGVLLAHLNAPPAPFVPVEYHNAPGYAVVLVGLNDTDAQESAIRELRAAVPPLFTFDTPIPYTQLQQMFNDSAPWGIRGYEKAIYLTELTDAAIDVIAAHLPAKASPMSFIPIFGLGGAYARHDENDSAFAGRRDIRFVFNIAALSPDPETFAADRAWAKAFWADLVPHAAGTAGYVNFMSDLDPERILASYGKDKYNRLAAIKAVYDPDNVFHFNANIAPDTQ